MMERAGSTRVDIPAPASGSSDDLLRAVNRATAGRYEVLGALWSREGESAAYLAREAVSSCLVVLTLERGGNMIALTAHRTLDRTLPLVELVCPRCHAPRSAQSASCPSCRAPAPAVTPVIPAMPLGGTATPVAPASGDYAPLGAMEGSDGGLVIFGQHRGSGRIVAVRRPAAASPATEQGAALSREPAPLTRSEAPTRRSGAQPVLLPAAGPPPGERLPPRPMPREPSWVLPAVALIAVGTVALAAFVRARTAGLEATEAHGGSIAGTAARVPRVHAALAGDSARITLGASLPSGAHVAVDGVALAGGATSVAPGVHVLSFSAPGYVPVAQRVRVPSGQTLAWAPALVRMPEARAEPAEHRARASSAQRSRAAESAANGARAESLAAVSAAERCRAAYREQRWSDALRPCTHEAELGIAEAAYRLAEIYDRGLGVPADPPQAATWYRRAAVAGSREAAVRLGAMYETGRGVHTDAAEAVAWYRKAALLGDARAQLRLAKAYENGIGVAQSMKEAVSWYRAAAEQGDPQAQNYLGWLYGNGRGVAHDDAEAVRWFRRAAEQGDAQAQYNLGFMYANGRGVVKDDAQAIAWLRRAAAQGYERAAEELARRGITP
jgi:TPR repeat protein